MTSNEVKAIRPAVIGALAAELALAILGIVAGTLNHRLHVLLPTVLVRAVAIGVLSYFVLKRKTWALVTLAAIEGIEAFLFLLLIVITIISSNLDRIGASIFGTGFLFFLLLTVIFARAAAACGRPTVA